MKASVKQTTIVFLFAAALVFSGFSIADGKGEKHGNHSTGTGNSSGGESSGGGDSNLTIVDNSGPTGGIDSGAEVAITTGDTVLHTIREYEAVAQSVSSLNLGYCTSGGGVADKVASFNVGGTEFLCQINILIPMITGKAKNLHEQGDLAGAAAELKKIDALVEMGVKYLKRRAWTSWMEGLFRDIWWIFALALIGL